jgi:hypothetical protein
MRSLLFLFFIAFVPSLLAQKQSKCIDYFIGTNPANVKAKTELKEYNVLLKWQNLDALSGSRINCYAVKAIYTTGLDSDKVAWRNVNLTKIDNFSVPIPIGLELSAFNNFTYSLNETNFLREDFYKNIPAENIDLARWLVSDAIQMQGLIWYVFDSLKFNKDFTPKYLESKDIKFENWVLFHNQSLKFKWIGITKHGKDVCAIVKFESLYNPVSMQTTQMSFKGRSLYWGELWISLEDKQLEYAYMIEDVIFKLKTAQSEQGNLLNLQREVTFETLKK